MVVEKIIAHRCGIPREPSSPPRNAPPQGFPENCGKPGIPRGLAWNVLVNTTPAVTPLTKALLFMDLPVPYGSGSLARRVSFPTSLLVGTSLFSHRIFHRYPWNSNGASGDGAPGIQGSRPPLRNTPRYTGWPGPFHIRAAALPWLRQRWEPEGWRGLPDRPEGSHR